MIDLRMYEQIFRPILFRIDPEDTHHFMHKLATWLSLVMPLLSPYTHTRDKNLNVSFAGIALENPVGLAAGFDKNGMLPSVLGHLGFGFAEIGSVTGRPTKGNPKPRIFRLLSDEAIINRLGLNGDGAYAIAERLKNSVFSLPIGINIAKTNDPTIKDDKAVEDILFSFNAIKSLPIKYVTINASCPNTHDGRIQQKEELSCILKELQKQNDVNLPVLLKISPDSSMALIHDLVALSQENHLSGFVCGNTTTSRMNLHTPAEELSRIGNGGLSGKPLKAMALNLVTQLYKLKSEDQTIIACGGISSGKDAYEFIRAGASAIQLYTALIYHGPFLPTQINRTLSSLLKKDGLSIKEAMGLDNHVNSMAAV